jgi:hypothetical protein
MIAGYHNSAVLHLNGMAIYPTPLLLPNYTSMDLPRFRETALDGMPDSVARIAGHES